MKKQKKLSKYDISIALKMSNTYNKTKIDKRKIMAIQTLMWFLFKNIHWYTHYFGVCSADNLRSLKKLYTDFSYTKHLIQKDHMSKKKLHL